ncbi:MAG TPA: phosphoglycerate kinase [Candidatus Lokiarchaeia archaeon]|nr:phosphoglycerate kinase [Candidatus Lokiarchaeia archaeon]
MEFTFKTINDVDLTGKKVLCRLDLNSPVDPDTKLLTSDLRIKASCSTIEALKDTALVILAHQGRFGDKDFIPLQQHAERLAELLAPRQVTFVDDLLGEKAIEACQNVQVGEVVVLDNVRNFRPDNDEVPIDDAPKTELVQKLAPYFDYFVVDAFGAAHRSQPSVVGWPRILAGPVVVKEMEALKKAFDNPERPLLMLVGGAKAIDKYKAVKNNIESKMADKVIVAGLTATLLYEGEGKMLGDKNRSVIDKDLDKAGPAVLQFMHKYGEKVILPVDFAVEQDGERVEISMEETVNINAPIMDIGPQTLAMFKDEIANARTIIANGPPGVFEKEMFATSTNELIDAMCTATANGAYTVIGGGEFGEAAEKSGRASEISWISTGGGAMLEFMAGKWLPLFVALERSASKFD